MPCGRKSHAINIKAWYETEYEDIAKTLLMGTSKNRPLTSTQKVSYISWSLKEDIVKVIMMIKQ